MTISDLSLIPRSQWRLLQTELHWLYCNRVEVQYLGVRSGYARHTSAWLVLQGAASMTRHGREVRAGVGQWLIGPLGERSHFISEDCKLLSIAFTSRWAFGQELFPLKEPQLFSVTAGRELRRRGMRLLAEARRSFPGAGNYLPHCSGSVSGHLRLTEKFWHWLVELERLMVARGIKPQLTHLDSRVEEVVQRVAQSHEMVSGPAELAHRVGLSMSRLNRIFRAQLGMTVKDYCQQRRLELARAQLMAPGSSIKETAFRLGFLSTQHFSRWFRKGTRLTPSQCQRVHDSA